MLAAEAKVRAGPRSPWGFRGTSRLSRLVAASLPPPPPHPPPWSHGLLLHVCEVSLCFGRSGWRRHPQKVCKDTCRHIRPARIIQGDLPSQDP